PPTPGREPPPSPGWRWECTAPAAARGRARSWSASSPRSRRPCRRAPPAPAARAGPVRPAWPRSRDSSLPSNRGSPRARQTNTPWRRSGARRRSRAAVPWSGRSPFSESRVAPYSAALCFSEAQNGLGNDVLLDLVAAAVDGGLAQVAVVGAQRRVAAPVAVLRGKPERVRPGRAHHQLGDGLLDLRSLDLEQRRLGAGGAALLLRGDDPEVRD